MNATAQFKTYACPNCGTPNSGTELQVHRGLKCVSCGTGYIPVKIETREFRTRTKESPAMLIFLGVFLLAILIVLGFVSIWLTLAIAAVGLLAGIFILLLRSKK